ncbi:unnamed protein product [Ceratitis capitata]|uniref:(Mediterranean fruit fly) hypothetical protein n=1 Tax=Ceratitis capitata TaxID=7213 RepID=A0A811VH80_CERCA|nr:unnamed protein product [Ceratitis capitata]
MYGNSCVGGGSKMDFTFGLITGAYAAFALIVFYIVYIIEVKLDLPGIINSHVGAPQTLAGQNSNQSNENVSPEVPEISQTRLRQMIELIIAETLRSPEIALNTHALSSRNGDVRQSGTTERYFEPRIYQELLATAVLNRIADKEGNFRQFSESTPDLSLSNINGNIDVQDRSISSTSSAEPRSDFSYTDTEQSPKVSKKFTSAGAPELI